jgi:hypothetical protein
MPSFIRCASIGRDTGASDLYNFVQVGHGSGQLLGATQDDHVAGSSDSPGVAKEDCPLTIIAPSFHSCRIRG